MPNTDAMMSATGVVVCRYTCERPVIMMKEENNRDDELRCGNRNWPPFPDSYDVSMESINDHRYWCMNH